MLKNDFIKIVIDGRPVAKKNNARIIYLGSRPSIVPSKAYCNYEADAIKQINSGYESYIEKFKKGEFLHVCCLYWLRDHRWFPDLTNLLNASHDILQKANVIYDDKYICSIDGSKICGFDKNAPRAEIFIRTIPYEYKEINK